MVHKFHPNSLSLSPPPPACAAIGAGGSVCEGESGEDHRGDCQEDVAPALAHLPLRPRLPHTLWGE